ncbi:MAG: hypothetical protein EOP87_11670 [Verrucomicrobiaceae bacterium]|nr:MAG: hypothetical protein EOP87_11670 [Verrucomicrobiaceae bacterium]
MEAEEFVPDLPFMVIPCLHFIPAHPVEQSMGFQHIVTAHGLKWIFPRHVQEIGMGQGIRHILAMIEPEGFQRLAERTFQVLQTEGLVDDFLDPDVDGIVRGIPPSFLIAPDRSQIILPCQIPLLRRQRRIEKRKHSGDQRFWLHRRGR